MPRNETRPLMKVLSGLPIKWTPLVLKIVQELCGPKMYIAAKHFRRALKSIEEESLVVQSMPCWKEEDGVVYLSVRRSSEIDTAFIRRLAGCGVCIAQTVRRLLHLIKPNQDIDLDLIMVAIVTSKAFTGKPRTRDEVNVVAQERGFRIPDASLAFFLGEQYSKEAFKAMGLRKIALMHSPLVRTNANVLTVLAERGRVAIEAYSDHDMGWFDGYAYVCDTPTPHVSSQ